MQDRSYSDIFISIAGLLTGISILLAYCYLGKVASESYIHMSDCIYELKWPKLRVRMQKSVILMIASMHESIFYHGLKIILLDLNTFIRVSFAQLNLRIL